MALRGRPTKKEIKLAKYLAKGEKQTDALVKAGYSKNSRRQIQTAKKKTGFQDLLDRYGPQLKAAFDVTKDGLKATTKHPQVIGRDGNGKPIYEYVEDKDHNIRLKAAEQVYRIHGVLQSDGNSAIHNGDNNQFNIYIDLDSPLATTIREIRPGDLARPEAVQDDQPSPEGT